VDQPTQPLLTINPIPYYVKGKLGYFGKLRNLCAGRTELYQPGHILEFRSRSVYHVATAANGTLYFTQVFGKPLR
jgi:hypothetical protein